MRLFSIWGDGQKTTFVVGVQHFACPALGDVFDGFTRPLVALTDDVLHLCLAIALCKMSKRASGFDGLELLRVTDEHQFGACLFHLVQKPLHLACADHASFIDDHHGFLSQGQPTRFDVVQSLGDGAAINARLIGQSVRCLARECCTPNDVSSLFPDFTRRLEHGSFAGASHPGHDGDIAFVLGDVADGFLLLVAKVLEALEAVLEVGWLDVMIVSGMNLVRRPEHVALQGKHLWSGEELQTVPRADRNGLVLQILVRGGKDFCRTKSPALRVLRCFPNEISLVEIGLSVGDFGNRILQGERLGDNLRVVLDGFLAEFFSLLRSPAMLLARRPPAPKQLFACDVLLHFTSGHSGDFGGFGALKTGGSERGLDLVAAFGKLFDEVGADSGHLEPCPHFLDTHAKTLAELMRQLGAIQSTGGHLVLIERLALDAAGRAILSDTEIQHNGMSVKLWVLGSARAMLKQADNQPALFADEATFAAPCIGGCVFQILDGLLNGFLVRCANLGSQLSGKLRPQHGNRFGS